MRMPERCLPQTCRNPSSFLKPDKTFGPKFAAWSSQKWQHAKTKTPSPGELTLLIICFSLLKVGWDRNTDSQTQEIMSVRLSCPNKHGRAPSDFTQSALKLHKLELDLQVASTKPPNPDPEVPSEPRHKPCSFCHWHGHTNIKDGMLLSAHLGDKVHTHCKGQRLRACSALLLYLRRHGWMEN